MPAGGAHSNDRLSTNRKLRLRWRRTRRALEGAPSRGPQPLGVPAAAKAKLTRAKRGTLGKKQRAAIVVVGTPHVTLGADGRATHPSVAEQAQLAAAKSPPSS